jgi:hypothetical protein
VDYNFAITLHGLAAESALGRNKTDAEIARANSGFVFKIFGSMYDFVLSQGDTHFTVLLLGPLL